MASHRALTPTRRRLLSLLRLGLIALAALVFINAATSAAVGLILLQGRSVAIDRPVTLTDAVMGFVVGGLAFLACTQGVRAINRRLGQRRPGV